MRHLFDRAHRRAASSGRLLALALGLCSVVAAGSVHAQRHDDDDRRFDRGREHVDARFHHDHVYLNRGVVVPALPREHFDIVHGGLHYYYAGGVWYVPRGASFVVVAPPVGLFVPVLPPYYTTIWVGGAPYYYADDAYYVYRGPDRGYEVVDPPPDQNAVTPQAPGPSGELFIYPRNGQSAEQQAQDRYECHSWASSQTGFDPTAPNGGVAPGETGSKRGDYDRAMTACLEGRGYTVK